MCRPADLIFDFLDKLVDPRCRPDGLLTLDAHEGRFVLLVRKIDLNRTAREQRATDEEHENDDVFPEQPTAMHQRITSSARTRIDCGIVRPIAFAVLRLTTNSNFVGCSTGRSA